MRFLASDVELPLCSLLQQGRRGLIVAVYTAEEYAPCLQARIDISRYSRLEIMSGWTILIVMAVMAGIAVGAFTVIPKGDNQT